ncbi:Uma2 family endonuclease [Nocardioides sp. LMS-CY]|nr:Uma2 family endonuclease [Nocardioides sp. LMS-CY]
MASMTTLPRGRQFTAADLAAMPDDGNRYELVDGALIVTPSPRFRHQRLLGRLYSHLDSTCPAGPVVLFAPFDVRISELTVLQPDLLVAPRTAFGEANLPGAPLLAVEVLSPSTRHIDLGLKRSAYEAARCPAYWVVDPEGPSVTAWELRGGEYVVAGTATGAETLTLAAPYPVSITPERLLD